jgi:ABC-2 type transport system ATP-binding protein
MLSYAGRLNGVASARLASRVDDVIGMTGLVGVADDLIETLSHGYRQRVGIATAIVHEPRLVVLDEPISGLDPAQIVEMRALIRGLKDKHTVLMSSHILGEVSETCDRILVLHGGRIVAQGSEALLRGNGGNKRIEIVARGALAQLQKSEVLTVDGVRDAEAIEQEGGLVRVRARFASDDAREQLIRSLVERGFGVRTVVELESDLEALFLKLTGAPSAQAAQATAPSTSQKEAA